jgi:hypothetical protein
MYKPRATNFSAPTRIAPDRTDLANSRSPNQRTTLKAIGTPGGQDYRSIPQDRFFSPLSIGIRKM